MCIEIYLKLRLVEVCFEKNNQQKCSMLAINNENQNANTETVNTFIPKSKYFHCSM